MMNPPDESAAAPDVDAGPPAGRGPSGAPGPFGSALVRLPSAFAEFAPGPRIDDRRAWDALPGHVRRALIARGELALGKPWPLLTASAYRAYVLRGNRTDFEGLHFERRRRLAALVLAECAENAGCFLEAAVDGIVMICEESGWQLPAHNAHARGGPRASLPDVERPVIDLFAAETGALLAVTAALLGERLDAQDPAIVRRLDGEIARRIVEPYRNTHFWWMGAGDEPMNNWTAWCTQNVLLTVFSRPTTQALRRAVVEKAAGSLDAFLKDYGEDGACAEGALYWRHAGLCVAGALAILSDIAPAAFAPLWRGAKLKAIAEFFADMNVSGPSYFNFGDASARLDRCGARELRFARAVGSVRLAALATADIAEAGESFERPEEINLWYRTLDAFGQEASVAVPTSAAVPRDIHYPSIGLTVARDRRFALAVKGGHNGDSHNHNDVGTLTLWRDASPVLIDLGVESYSAKTFSPARYDIWTMQSAWHNLPTFAGVMQSAGADHAARDHRVVLGEEEVQVSMDIAGAYPREAGIASYRRSIRLLKGRCVEIEDRWEGVRVPEMSLLFAFEPWPEAGGIAIETGARLAVEGGARVRIEAVDLTDERLRRAWGARVWRALIPIAGDRLRLVVT